MRKVLVVDDSALARKLLVRSLPAGWADEVAQVGDGSEAIAACRAGMPDVMFLDLNMPNVDGYEVLKQLEGAPNLPTVVVVSADVQPIAQERVFAMGAKAFVKKPATPAEIVAALRQAGAL